MQKHLNKLIITGLVLIIIGGAGYIGYMILFGSHSGHTNMSSAQGASNNTAGDTHSSHGTHSTSDNTATSEHSSHSMGYNIDISGESSSTGIAEKSQNTNVPAKIREPDLTNVVFIDYVVNPTDTLWRISRIYMPDFPVLDTGDTMGIITYIAQKNKLKKGLNGEYVIYYGQKLSIPAEKAVVSKVVNTSRTNTSSPSSNYSSTSSTPKSNESSSSTQTDHSSHGGNH